MRAARMEGPRLARGADGEVGMAMAGEWTGEAEEGDAEEAG